MSSSCFFLFCVGHYLWGIDTFRKTETQFFCLLMVGHYLWGIDTLQRMKFHQEFSLWTSDITYEELTPVSSLSSLTAPSIGRTLPMRNWHGFLLWLTKNGFPLSVGHYLWGIDTCCNSFYATFVWSRTCRSDITYEELTQSSSRWLNLPYLPKFVGHYLWGIDTF